MIAFLQIIPQDTLKIIHILAWASWMAGMFYLPRLFVYHVERGQQSAHTAQTLEIMELKLLRFIMNPAMIVTWITGLWLLFGYFGFAGNVWLHIKLVLVLLMSAFHGMCSKWRKELAAGSSEKTGRFFRIANEVPTLLFVFIVILAVIKPF